MVLRRLMLGRCLTRYSRCTRLGESHLGLKPLVTQHLLDQPYFKSVTENEIVVQWQQLASHGRRDGSEEIRRRVIGGVIWSRVF